MRTAKAVLSLLVSATMALPASAQVRAAASVAGSALPRVSLAAPLALAAAPAPLFASAPALALSAFDAAAAPVVPAASAAPIAASVIVPGGTAAAPSAASLSRVAAAARPPGSAPADADAPAAAESSRWERFWTGASARPTGGEPLAAPSARGASDAAPRGRAGLRLSAAPAATVAATALVAAPELHGAHAVLAEAVPFLEGGALLVGTYFVNRVAHALLRRFAEKRGMDRHQLAAVRLVATVALWTGAAAGALVIGGAAHSTLTAVLGAGGTILTLGLRDILGNVMQGVSFLLARPFAIGTRVQINDDVGVVSDATLTMLIVRKDDGTEVKIRHSALAAKPVIVFAEYKPDAKLRLTVPAKPRFQGAFGALWSSMDRRFWIAAAATGALVFAPAYVPFLTAGWAATGVHYALAGSIGWLTWRVGRALTAVINQLSVANGWRKETTVITRLAVTGLLWIAGGSAAMRVVGVTWAALGTSLGAGVGFTTLGIGLASNNFFGSVLQGMELLFSKPFKVGEQVRFGTFSGVVEDMTLYHVVVKLDSGRYALLPYSAVLLDTLAVPGK